MSEPNPASRKVRPRHARPPRLGRGLRRLAWPAGGVAAFAAVLALILVTIPSASRPTLAADSPRQAGDALAAPPYPLPTSRSVPTSTAKATPQPTASHRRVAAAKQPATSRTPSAPTHAASPAAPAPRSVLPAPLAAQSAPAPTPTPVRSHPSEPVVGYELVNAFFAEANPGRCVVPTAARSGAAVVQAPCRSGVYWTRTQSAAGYQFHLGTHPTLCLGATGSAPASGAPVVLSSCTSATARWQAGAGSRLIAAAAPSLCLTGYAIPSADGRYPGYLFPCDNSATNQSVKIERMS